MILYIKNMVCNRCITAVQGIFKELDIPFTDIRLGEVEIEGELSDPKLKELSGQLQQTGFAIIDDHKSKIIGKIKSLLIDLVHHKDDTLKVNLSVYLSSAIHYDYHYLSNLFSDIEGTTIEKYYIAQKIEKVKELLVYDELSLSEIADDLGYSSVAYLSNQFKKVTGLTPGHFKRIRAEKRKPLDEV